MIEKSLQNSKTLGFTYPNKNHGCFFIWPWEYSGGFIEYFYSKKTSVNKNNKSSITTRRIFGFTFVSTKWLCDPLEAYYLYRQGMSRLLSSLDNEIDLNDSKTLITKTTFDKNRQTITSFSKVEKSNIEKQLKLNNIECCGNDCGCH